MPSKKVLHTFNDGSTAWLYIPDPVTGLLDPEHDAEVFKPENVLAFQQEAHRLAAERYVERKLAEKAQAQQEAAS